MSSDSLERVRDALTDGGEHPIESTDDLQHFMQMLEALESGRATITQLPDDPTQANSVLILANQGNDVYTIHQGNKQYELRGEGVDTANAYLLKELMCRDLAIQEITAGVRALLTEVEKTQSTKIEFQAHGPVFGAAFQQAIQALFATRDWMHITVTVAGQVFKLGDIDGPRDMMAALTDLTEGGLISVDVPNDIEFDREAVRAKLEAIVSSSWNDAHKGLQDRLRKTKDQ